MGDEEVKNLKLDFSWITLIFNYIFCDLYNLTSNLIYMKGHLKHFEFLPPLDLLRDPTGKRSNRPKFCQNIFWPITTSKPSIIVFRQNGTWDFFHYILQLKTSSLLFWLFLSGKVGDWKSHFTVAQNEVLDAFIRDKLAGTGLTFDYW